MANLIKVRLGYRMGNLVGSVSKLKVKVGAGDVAQRESAGLAEQTARHQVQCKKQKQGTLSSLPTYEGRIVWQSEDITQRVNLRSFPYAGLWHYSRLHRCS